MACYKNPLIFVSIVDECNTNICAKSSYTCNAADDFDNNLDYSTMHLRKKSPAYSSIKWDELKETGRNRVDRQYRS